MFKCKKREAGWETAKSYTILFTVSQPASRLALFSIYSCEISFCVQILFVFLSVNSFGKTTT